MQPLNLDEVRKFAENMEFEAARFYRKAAETTRDASVRQLLVELAEAEVEHESLAHKLEQKIYPERARRGGRDRAAHFPAAIRAAGAGRTDGRLGLDLGAAVRRRLRHPQHLGDLPGRHGGLGRRRHFHGLCRGGLRRRLAHRTRHAVAARHGLRGDDHDRRRGAHPALSHSRFLDRHLAGGDRGRGRARGDLVYPLPLHGHAVPLGRVPGRGRRHAGVSRRAS